MITKDRIECWECGKVFQVFEDEDTTDYFCCPPCKRNLDLREKHYQRALMEDYLDDDEEL